jgi:hypothetical protein
MIGRRTDNRHPMPIHLLPARPLEALMRRRWIPVVLVAVALALGRAAAGPAAPSAVIADLPERLTGAELWTLSTTMSEPDGSFRSENMVSNEMVFARLLPDVVARVDPGGVYLGVGPEQNFTYIAATRSRMAFITDIRRGNLHVILMYKALFELSADRAEFVSRLFTRARPAGLTASSTARQIMDAYATAPRGNEAAFRKNLDAVLQHLVKTRDIPLGADDRTGVGAAYRTFFFYGPEIDYMASTLLTPSRGFNSATYRDLMTQTDPSGKELGYLGSEGEFRYVKELNDRNLIIPLVGNFAGPKTIRAIGDYVRRRSATVSAFYVSTVEPYLRRDGTLPEFCASVATLPTTGRSVFIRPGNLNQFTQSASEATRAAVTPAVIAAAGGTGQYQTGILVPISGGCG